MPARSRASHEVSSSSRCCGSIARASRGEIPNSSASNSVASSTNPPTGRDVVQHLRVPAAVHRQRRHPVTTGVHQLPQRLGRGHTTWVTATHTNDRDRLIDDARTLGRTILHGLFLNRTEQLLTQIPGEGSRGRVVEDHRGGQVERGRATEPITQIHSGQRVETEILERPGRIDRRGGGMSEHGSDRRLHRSSSMRSAQPRADPSRRRASAPPSPAADRPAVRRC